MAAAALGSRILRQAADAYDRAARAPYARIPQPSPAGNRLRQAARLICAFAYLTGDRTLTPIILLTRLAALAEAVAELRESQQRAAQAAAACAAAEHLYAAARPSPAARPQAPSRARTAADLAADSFPGPPVPPRTRKPAPGQRGADQPAPRPPQAGTAPATRPHPLTAPGKRPVPGHRGWMSPSSWGWGGLACLCSDDGQGHGGVVGDALLPGFVEVAAVADLRAMVRGDEGVVEAVALAAAPVPAMCGSVGVQEPVRVC